MNEGKNSPKVVRFMSLFQKMRGGLEDRPQDLLKLAFEAEEIKALALDLDKAAKALVDAERRRPQLFAAPADPKFIAMWREFEDRYAPAVSEVTLYDFFGDLLGRKPDEVGRDGGRQETGRFEIADTEAKNDARSLDEAIDFAFQQVSDETRDFPEDFVIEVKEGIDAWEKLSAQYGSDLAGVLRRRALVPFVLIPRHISRHHGDTEKLSLLTHLQQAQTAFVCGAPFAALALMRTILEVTLTEHYGAQGKNLKQWISNCPDLPARAPVAALDRLRRHANAVLHFNQDEVTVSDNMEKDLLQHLIVLRELIEGAPEK